MTNELKNDSQKPNIPQYEKKSRSVRSNSENQRRFYKFRLIPIWLRIVLVLILIYFAVTAGLMIGYGIIGDGKPLDALKWGTYKHIFDIISGKE